MPKKSVLCGQLFASFFKIGAFTFGGGYAMIPLIQKETVEKRKWVSDEDILDIVAIAESTPGPIAINSSTFIGYRVCGVIGAICATVGMVLPSFTIITIIAYVLQQFQSILAVKYAFFGIRAGVLALICKALLNMYKKSQKNLVAYIIMAASFIAAGIFGINVLLIIIGCAIVGLVTSLLQKAKQEEVKKP